MVWQALEAGEAKKLHLNTLSPPATPATPAQRAWPHLIILGWSSTSARRQKPLLDFEQDGYFCYVAILLYQRDFK